MVVKQKKENKEEEEEEKKDEEFIIIVNNTIIDSFCNFKKGIDRKYFRYVALFRRKSHSEPLVNQVIAFAAQEEAEVGR